MQCLFTLERCVILMLLGLLAWILWQQLRPRLKWLRQQHVKPRIRRQWRPKSPEDCPACQRGVHLTHHSIRRDVVPYAQCKSKRGRRKAIARHGRACLNPDCEYFGITDAAIYALVGNGKRGQYGDIQHFRCQGCHTDFSARRDTPLYYLKTDLERVTLVFCLLAEGVDVAVLVRVTGHSEATITRWLQRAGYHGQRLHNQFFR